MDIEILNMLLLFAVALIISSIPKNNFIRFLVSLFTSLAIVLQLCSLYFVKSFTGYQFYLHFNSRAIGEIIYIHLLQVVLFIALLIFLVFLFYSQKNIIDKAIQFSNKINLQEWFSRKINYNYFNVIKLIVVAIAIIIMSLNEGVINTSLELVSILNVNEDRFDKSINDAGLEDYTAPGKLEVVKGKNIIIISLESFEKGYLSNRLSHLTPNLSSLKNEWRYYNMYQNMGSDWTNGFLYTYLTGIPAIFGMHGNAFFKTAYHSSITSIGHVLKNAGYKMTYLTSDAKFSRTQEILHSFQINNIIDKYTLGKHCRDKDLFEKAKVEIQANLLHNKPFALFLSTHDTHFPDGIYDERMEKHVASQNSNLEFMVSAVDYMIGDFINFLKRENILSNTVVYIFPNHLKMGDPSIFDATGDRSLFLLTSAIDTNLTFDSADTLSQIELPRLILDGADIKHNTKFLSDYISVDKQKYLRDNVKMLTTLNTSGISRINSKLNISAKVSKNYALYKNDTNRFIAHAGGMVADRTYTNSLEALMVNYNKGFRLFELDIIKTRDGKYVAAHDWASWARIANYKGNLPVTTEEFLKQKIYSLYTPLDMNGINQWFSEHKDAILVTDKINKPKAFSNQFVDKKRLMMELFTLKAVKEGVEANIKSSMPSTNVVDNLGGDRVKKLKQLGVSDIAISRRYIAQNIDFLKKLKENNIRTYVFHVNHDLGKNENYVVKYEMDNIYGLYADKWDFDKRE